MAEMALNGTTSFSSDAKVHPGEVLREDFLKPLGMSANALAKALSAPAPRINDVVRRRGISADTAMRLARYFGSDARSWLNLQTAYDLRVAEILPAYCVHRRSMHTGHLLVPTRRDVSQVLPDDNQRSRRSA
jgi:addiction module HigA family antidote